jgi:hypothetical protein
MLLSDFDPPGGPPTPCELGDHSGCDHAPEIPDMPVMVWDVPARCARGDHSWCPDGHQPVTLRSAWGGFQEL